MKISFFFIFTLLCQLSIVQYINDKKAVLNIATSFMETKGGFRKISNVQEIDFKGIWIANLVNLQSEGWKLLSKIG